MKINGCFRNVTPFFMTPFLWDYLMIKNETKINDKYLNHRLTQLYVENSNLTQCLINIILARSSFALARNKFGTPCLNARLEILQIALVHKSRPESPGPNHGSYECRPNKWLSDLRPWRGGGRCWKYRCNKTQGYRRDQASATKNFYSFLFRHGINRNQYNQRFVNIWIDIVCS